MCLLIENTKNTKDPPVSADVVKGLVLSAIVTQVIPGKHGFYAVTVSSFNGNEIYITFSLGKEILEEDISFAPEVLQQLPGTSVVLSNIVKKQKGWRALHARFHKPSDDEKVFASEIKQVKE